MRPTEQKNRVGEASDDNFGQVDSDDDAKTTIGETRQLRERLPQEGHEFQPYHVATLVSNSKDSTLRRFESAFRKLNRIEAGVDELKAKQGIQSRRRRSSGEFLMSPRLKSRTPRHTNQTNLPPEIRYSKCAIVPWMVRNKTKIIAFLGIVQNGLFHTMYEPAPPASIPKEMIKVSSVILAVLLALVTLLI